MYRMYITSRFYRYLNLYRKENKRDATLRVKIEVYASHDHVFSKGNGPENLQSA